MLVLHLAAAALAEQSASRRRFRTFVAWFGASLALIALAQIAVAATRIYGIFMPLESKSFFGAFVNRDHFAAYMTLCAMAGLAILHRALQSYRHRLGTRSNLRRQIVTLGTPEGVRLILAVVPVLMTIGALIATTSRGGILSFVGALVLASVVIRRHQERLPVGALVFLLVLPLAWFGLERLEVRFGRMQADKIGRTAIWRHSVASMSGTWLTGAGLNTFRAAVSRVLPLSMPAGAAPWPGEVAEALPAQLHIGYRTPVDLPGWQWYEEAHNDYVQLAVEMGLIGVAIGIWALVILAARMREPWLASAVVGILMHSTVDFSLQIPAVAVLFFVVCAYAGKRPPLQRS
jgi:O-antigen ligase